MSKNRNWPPRIIKSYKERIRKDALNELIESHLVDTKIKEANILLNRAEEILKDLIERIKGGNGNICPSMQGGSSCGLTAGEV